MAYIKDLAPYDYYPGVPDALAVGWLDESESFAAGPCPQDVRDRLADLARKPVRLMRGRHYCQFCERKAGPPRPLRADTRLYEVPDVAWGNGEIWLTAPDGTNYAAPVLFVHYIDEHAYLPPAAFLDAVRTGVRTEGVS